MQDDYRFGMLVYIYLNVVYLYMLMHLCKYSLSCVVSQPWALGLPGLGFSKLELQPCDFGKCGTITCWNTNE
jgi:hypothetical protein